MILFLRDLYVLSTLSLPPSMSRKRLMLDFLILWAKSVRDRLARRGAPKAAQTMQAAEQTAIESEIWRNFSKILTIYLRHLEPRYLLTT